MQTRPMPYYELLAAITRPDPNEPPACAICLLVRRALLLWIEDLVYSFGVDPGVRLEVRLARSLCNRHAHLLSEIRSVALGVSLIHLDVIDTVREELERGLGAAKHTGARPFDPRSLLQRVRNRAKMLPVAVAIQTALAPKRSCLACDHQEQVERLYLQTLLRHLSDAELADAFGVSPGLCLPHFRQAAGISEDAASLRLLATIELDRMARLRDELAEFARKNDHRHLNEPVGAEADAWLRSIDHVTGLGGVR